MLSVSLTLFLAIVADLGERQLYYLSPVYKQFRQVKFHRKDQVLFLGFAL